MELGNLIFGNSRGKYEFTRDEDKDEIFYELVELLEKKENSFGTVPHFENDVFITRPYYWGDCNCGWGAIDDGHKSLYDLRHRRECIKTETKKVHDKYSYEEHDKQLKEIKKLYLKYKIDFDKDDEDWWHGWYAKCTCDYDKRQDKILKKYVDEFGHTGHKETCALVLPNFVYKPENIQIEWYKYPFRDSYINKKISLEKFIEIINHCKESIKTR